LPAGTYDVSLTLPGLAPFARKGVMVSGGKTATVDIELNKGSQLSTLGEDSLAIAARCDPGKQLALNQTDARHRRRMLRRV
jgi:hypothetical protein